MKRAAFLDRDGVVNRSIIENSVPRPPRNFEELEILDGVIEALSLLRKNDIIPVVITNQPDVARGATTKAEVDSLNNRISQLTGIESFYTCIHDDLDNCRCRKPLPGLILKSENQLGLDRTRSFLVGDRWRDIEAGQSVGLKSYFIDYSYPGRQPKMPFVRVTSLLSAIQIELGEKYAAES
jgi:D-glycero-D-manno-heptose 1,7-bisphosphate phosphatase